MATAALRVCAHVHTPLDRGWCFARAQPDGSAPDRDAAWQAMDTLLPVAAALRALGQWSLEAAPVDFDQDGWWYRLHFDAPAQAPVGALAAVAPASQWLVLEGLATLATVYLNGAPLLSSANMFVHHACDVSGKLQVRGNELVLYFGALDPHLAQKKGRPRWRTPMVRQQQLRWLRTTLLGRTPGWSPPVAVVGPWRPIRLETRTRLALPEPTLHMRVDGTDGLAVCSVELAPLDGARIASVELQLRRGDACYTQVLQAPAGTACYAGMLRLAQVALWWPHTHGEPALYAAQLCVRLAGQADAVVVAQAPVGFRTVHLERSGDNFALYINQVRVFCRGAVWTPLDPVTLDAPDPAYHAALAQVAQAGMNMLRVAGNMAYESAAFFQACDALGLLVWQDFMFSNMDYPEGDASWRASALCEVTQQLKRQQSSPSRVLLCGNSEVAQQAAMWGAERAQWHSAFFEDELATLCAQHAPGTPYWPSSAYGGAFPHQSNAGTASYYGVGAYLRPLEDARRSGLRFASECLAFANVPESPALARMPGSESLRVHHPEWKRRSPRDLGAGWDFEDVRDHYLETLFKTHARMLRYQDHDRYLTLSRVATGEAMAAAFAEWRRPGSACNGALVLFLRDLWAGAGWGLLDDAGAPKACFHYLRRTLQPQAVFLSDEGGSGLFVHVHNEGPLPLDATLSLSLWRQTGVLVAQGQCRLQLAANDAQSLPCMQLLQHFTDLNHAYRFGPPVCDVVVATLHDGSGAQRGQAFHFPQGLSDAYQSGVGLSAQARLLDENTAELSLRTQGLAQGVHFQLKGFVADDAYFHMAPKEQRSVLLRRIDQHTAYGEVHAINSREVAAFTLAP